MLERGGGAGKSIESGIYFGWAGLSLADLPPKASDLPSGDTFKQYPAVLSIGYNPFYGNTTRSIEVHILHEFSHDFYGHWLNVLVMGYIRPEYGYEGVEALVVDIRFDCDVARRSLERQQWRADASGSSDGGKWLMGVDKTEFEESEAEIQRQGKQDEERLANEKKAKDA